MARIKRVGGSHAKVKKEGGQRFLWSKKFWILCSSILAGLIIVGVTIGLIIYFNRSTSTKKDYFRSCEEVEFKYASYDGIANYANPEFNNPQGGDLTIDYMFVLVYNSGNFYPSESDDSDNYSEEDKNLLNGMIDLQKTIDTQKKAGKDVELFIVDTYYSWNVNAYTESLFGSLYTEDSSSFSPMLVYIENGEYAASYNANEYDSTAEDKDIYISSNSTATNGLSEAYIYNTLFNKITKFINNYLGKDK